MKRRILAFFLALVLIGTMLPTQVWAASAPTVSCSSTEAMPGQEAVVDLTAENLPAVGSLSVELFYDSEALELVRTEQGGMLDSADQVSVNDQTPGCLRIKAISLDGISGSGALLQVTFRVRENCPAGNYTLSTAVGEVLGTDLAPVTVQGRNGRVHVEAGAERPDTFGIYMNCDRTPLEKGEVLAVQVWQRDSRPFSSAEFSLLYDRDHFRVVSAALGETLLQEGAVHSINQATEGVVRVAYASDTPVSGSLLLTVKLQVTADLDAVSTLEARAENVWQEPGRPYLPGKAQDTVTLHRKEETVLPRLSLETERLVVGQETGAVLTLEKGSRLAAANFMLTYDPTVLSCVTVSAAPEVKAHGGMVMINDNYQQGKVRFTYLNESAWSEGNLPLLRITWKPLRSPQEHYQVIPGGEGVVDLGQKPVHLDYVTDSGCIYEKEVVPPACTEEGYTAYRCACGAQLREDIQSPLGHIYSKDPFSCDRCGEERRVKSIAVAAMPEKTVYLQEAETPDLRGGTLRVAMEDGAELTLPMQEAEVLGFDNRLPGEKTLTLRLRGAETTLMVEVIPNFRLPLHLEITTGKDGMAQLRWNGPEGVDRYEVYCAVNGGAEQRIGTTTQTAMQTPIRIGDRCEYIVYGLLDQWPEGKYTSNRVSYIGKYAAPQLEAQLNEEGKPVLQWNAVSGAVSYTVLVSDKDNTFTELVTQRGTTFCHRDAAYDTAYRYQVRANGTVPEVASDVSNTVCITPVQPLSAPVLKACLDQQGKPVLEWSFVPGAESYTVLVSEDGQHFKPLATQRETTLCHQEARYGTTYCYQVRAHGEVPEAASEVSNTVHITPVSSLTAPVLKAHLDEAYKPVLEWSAVPGAVSYTVWASPNGLHFRLAGTLSETKFCHQNAQAGVTYRYYVSVEMEDPALTCGSSNIVEITALKQLQEPTCWVGMNEEGLPYLQWYSVTGAQKYKVFVSEDGTDFQSVYFGAETSYVHRDAQYGPTYFYRVQACADYAVPDSGMSRTMTFTLVKRLESPRLDSHLNEAGKPVLEWNAVPGAMSYTVEAALENGEYVPVSTVKETTFCHEEAQYGSSYFYRVIANGTIPEESSEPSNMKREKAEWPLGTPVIQEHTAWDKRPYMRWDAVRGAVSYTVFVSVNDEPFVELETVTQTEFYHIQAQYGEKYTYRVRANGDKPGVVSDMSNSVTIIPMLLPDAASSRNDTTGKPYLWWTEVPGATSYEVWYSEEYGVFHHLYTAKGTRLNHNSAKLGVMYRYKVRAVMGQETGNFGSETEVFCACAMPKVSLSHNAEGKPVLRWQKVSGATGYEVYRSIDGGDFYSWTNVRGTQLNHGSAVRGYTYAYRVRALYQDARGNSALSDPVSGTIEEVQLGVPTLSISNKSSTGKPYLKWTAVDGAAKYEVWRATSKTGSYSRLFTTSGTSLTNGSTTAGRTYYYKVRAIAANGTAGEFSEVKLRTCDCARPDVKLSVRSGHPRLDWQKVSGAVKYEVYCSINGGSFRRLLTVKGTSLTHSSARKGTTYRYRVRALCSRSAGNSAWSYYDTIKVK